MGEFWNAIQNASEIERRRILEEQEKKRIRAENELLEKRKREEMEIEKKREYEERILIPFRNTALPIFQDLQSNHPEIKKTLKSEINETSGRLILRWGNMFPEDGLSLHEERIMRDFHYEKTSFFSSPPNIPEKIKFADYASFQCDVYTIHNENKIYLCIDNGRRYNFDDFIKDPKIIIPTLLEKDFKPKESFYHKGVNYWIDKKVEAQRIIAAECDERERHHI